MQIYSTDRYSGLWPNHAMDMLINDYEKQLQGLQSDAAAMYGGEM